MPVTDPIADMLTRIRNAQTMKHPSLVMPVSKMKLAIAKILKEESFIRDYDVLRAQPQPSLRIHLSYRDDSKGTISGLKRISKPGLRIYVGRGEIPRVYGGLGIAIMSTSHGLMTGGKAWRQKIGGELLCYVW